MSLRYPGEWKFEGIGFEIPPAAVEQILDLIMKIADGSKEMIEQFKAAFGNHNSSSSYDWAESDLRSAVHSQTTNAALFIDSLWKGIERAKEDMLPVPNVEYINGILMENNIPLRIQPPDLILIDSDSIIIDKKKGENSSDKEVVSPTYTLHEELGVGGYGVVYRATRETAVTQFEYALKVLDPSPFVEDYDKAVKRFSREVEILKLLQHRAIITYYDAGISSNGKPYVVMPLIKGANLLESCRQNGFRFTISSFIEILGALEYAHQSDVIHRDLKPSNIIVRSGDNQPIILDFGSAYTLDQMDSKTLTTQAVGTIGYIPSEVLMNPKKRTMLHDIFACGIMLYESLAGVKPDPANYTPLTKIRSDCNGLDPIIERAIAGEAKRIPSAKKFSDALKRFL